MENTKKYKYYKKKYHLLRNNLIGGERHNNIITKSGNQIIFPKGFPNLKKNGDYHIIHGYDNSLGESKVQRHKIEQLNMWVNQTFNYELPPDDWQKDSIISKVGNIFKTNPDDLITIIDWLNRSS